MYVYTVRMKRNNSMVSTENKYYYLSCFEVAVCLTFVGLLITGSFVTGFE